MRRSRWLAVALLLSLPPAAAAAQEPTQVAVHAKLTDRMFRLRFGQQAAEVEKQLATAIAEQLGKRLGFVRFVPLGTQQHRLTFSLDRNDRASTGQQVDRGFWVKLTQPGKDSVEAYWFTLRPAHATSGGVGTREALIAEVRNKLELQNYDALERLLGNVPVALEALVSDAPLGWALPFRRDVLCMMNETELRVDQIEVENQVRFVRPYAARVRATFSRDPGPEKRQYRNGLVGEPHDATLKANLQRAIRQKLVQGIEAVYVTDYQHVGNCGLQAVAPRVGGGS